MEPVQTFTFVGDDLLRWQPAHGVTVRLADGLLVVADSPALDWHLLRLESPDFLLREITLRMLVWPLPGQDANVSIHHYGDLDVGEVAADGTVLDHGISESLAASRRGDGSLAIRAVFLCHHPSLSLGCKRGAARYRGSGRDQFAIERIDVEVASADALLRAVPDAARLQVVDVGGAGGLPLKWLRHAARITPTLFEPNPDEAAKLRDGVDRIPGGRVIERGLAHVEGPRTLNITRYWGCTSMLQPNFAFLSRYPIRRLFDVERTIEVDCSRYDTLHRRGEVPAPGVLKVDVQGFEFEVLLGFGDLLAGCLGVELEAHLYPLYQDQKLLHDLVDLLDGFGLVLRALRPVAHFDGDLVEADAFFTRRREAVAAFGPLERAQFDLVTEVWGLPAYGI